MVTYYIEGYTSSCADFTGTLDLPEGFDFEALAPCSDIRYSLAHNIMMEALLASDADVPSDYLDVFCMAGFEPREDLVSEGDVAVLCGEAYGCDNCQNEGDNEYQDGCDDSPHGGYLITFRKVA